ncbi:TPA: RomA family MBL fold metallo-hydrolase, partial [Enterobacter asburiae]|nr:RomA family MBL fold metallo-hydrolase [Enterobacter asburiae]
MNKPLFICVVLIMIIASAASLPFVLNAGFGQPPQGEQLTEVEASPQYRDGKFHNT